MKLYSMRMYVVLSIFICNSALSTVIEIKSSQEFNIILKNNKPTIADFSAAWCGPCQQMKPIFKELADEYRDINFIVLDANNYNLKNILSRYAVVSLPTFIFFDANGTEIEKREGSYQGKQEFEKAIKKFRNKSVSYLDALAQAFKTISSQSIKSDQSEFEKISEKAPEKTTVTLQDASKKPSSKKKNNTNFIKETVELEKEDLELKKQFEKESKTKGYSDEGFLGSWILKEHPQKIIVFDEKEKIYQVRVFQQESGDCWIHAFRNSLYFVDMICSPRESFAEIYANLVNKGYYYEFNTYGCPAPGFLRPWFKEKLSCKPQCIPQKSTTYLSKIVIFGYSSADSEKNQWKIAPEVLKTFYEFRKNNNNYLGLNLYINDINHGVTLIIHKYNDGIEYVYSDSNNMPFMGRDVYWDFTTEHQEYQTAVYDALKQIISYMQNPELFDAFSVKVLYDDMVDRYNELKNSNKKNWAYFSKYGAQELRRFYDNLKKYNLLKSDVYVSTYKLRYCDVIKQEKSVYKNYSDLKWHNALLKEISCETL